MPNPVRLLLIEDDPDDAFFMRLAFGQACPSALLHRVADGDEAVAWLAGDGPYADRTTYPLPDQVLLDLKLPRRSGLDVLRWIRAQPCFTTLPVTVLSGSGLPSDMNEAHTLGVRGYLQKPVSLSGFNEAVRAFCAREGLG